MYVFFGRVPGPSFSCMLCAGEMTCYNALLTAVAAEFVLPDSCANAVIWLVHVL
jgi:hypothetical protein